MKPHIVASFLKKADSLQFDFIDNDGIYKIRSGSKLDDLAGKINKFINDNYSSLSDEVKSLIQTPKTNDEDGLRWIKQVDIRRLRAIVGPASLSEKKIALFLFWIDGSFPDKELRIQSKKQYDIWAPSALDEFEIITNSKKNRIPKILQPGKKEVYFIGGKENGEYKFLKSILEVTTKGSENEKVINYASLIGSTMSGKCEIDSEKKMVTFTVDSKGDKDRYFSFTGHLNQLDRLGENIVNGIGVVKYGSQIYSTPIVIKPTLEFEDENIELLKPKTIHFRPKTNVLSQIQTNNIISYLASKKRARYSHLRPNSHKQLNALSSRGQGPKQSEFDTLLRLFQDKSWTSFSRIFSLNASISVFSWEFIPDYPRKEIFISHRRSGQAKYVGKVKMHDDRFLVFDINDESRMQYPQRVFAKIFETEDRSIMALKCLSTVIKVNLQRDSEIVTVREIILSKGINEFDFHSISADGLVKENELFKLDNKLFPDELKSYLINYEESILSYNEFGSLNKKFSRFLRTKEQRISGKYEVFVDDGENKNFGLFHEVEITNQAILKLKFNEQYFEGPLKTYNLTSWATLYTKKPDYTEPLQIQIKRDASKGIGHFEGFIILQDSINTRNKISSYEIILKKLED